MRKLLSLAGMLLAVLGASLFLPAIAQAAFNSAVTATLTTPYASATFAAPSNLSVTTSCAGGNPTARLTWTASSSAFTTGYTVLDEVNGGSQATVISGVTTTSYTMALTKHLNYVVAVEATYLSWTSAPTAWSASFKC